MSAVSSPNSSFSCNRSGGSEESIRRMRPSTPSNIHLPVSENKDLSSTRRTPFPTGNALPVFAGVSRGLSGDVDSSPTDSSQALFEAMLNQDSSQASGKSIRAPSSISSPQAMATTVPSLNLIMASPADYRSLSDMFRSWAWGMVLNGTECNRERLDEYIFSMGMMDTGFSICCSYQAFFSIDEKGIPKAIAQVKETENAFEIMTTVIGPKYIEDQKTKLDLLSDLERIAQGRGKKEIRAFPTPSQYEIYLERGFERGESYIVMVKSLRL
ncbi:MAG TPA: hypothetical protein VLE96_05650 [Chlamydiales bacterium]|nr:hypothetical protein [Chlamydiales bacterium]